MSSCSSTISQNCTYIQNPGYSSAYTTAGACSYTVTPVSSNICQIRLDFEKFVTTIATDGKCTDSFVATGPTNTNGLDVVCGTLTDQHSKYIVSLIKHALMQSKVRLKWCLRFVWRIFLRLDSILALQVSLLQVMLFTAPPKVVQTQMSKSTQNRYGI